MNKYKWCFNNQTGCKYRTKLSEHSNNTREICLKKISNINVVNHKGENKFLFNGFNEYKSNYKYKLSKGTYTLKNIPKDHPMAVISNNSTITYSGDNKITKKINGVNRNFYYGDIRMTVNDNFKNASVYCYYHGYMGGERIFIYDNSCSSIHSTQTINNESPVVQKIINNNTNNNSYNSNNSNNNIKNSSNNNYNYNY